MTSYSTSPFTVNGRTYSPPARPVAVVCLDGTSDAYLDAALRRGLMPQLAALIARGFRQTARAAMPTFTNVNNAGIATGAAPRVHGISGNFFFDPGTGREVMMNSPRLLRADPIFPAAQRAGRRVAVITAKEKLRDILGAGLIAAGGIAFSSEKALTAARSTHGIDGVEAIAGPTPPIYSGEASLYVFRAGRRLLQDGLADFLYLSTTDYIQHKHGPDHPEALKFYRSIDGEIGHLLQAGARIGITADHGMNAKHRADGTPNVIFLETELGAAFGEGVRVILPITDPYVAHHGALGSFAQIYLPPGLDAQAVHAWLQRRRLGEALDRETASDLLELPADRTGDFVLVAAPGLVIGRTEAWHDLSSVGQGLRSHGGYDEQNVPFIVDGRLGPRYAARADAGLRNFDIFEFACNGPSDSR